jgi:hypothetical protein
MTDREMVLERLRSANPLPDTDHVDAEELGLFVSYFEERKADMQTEKRPTPQAPLRRRQNGWLVAAGAAIAVFVLIGGSLWLVSRTGTDAVEEPLVTTTSAVPTTVALVDAWQRVGGSVMEPVVGMFDMTVVGSRLFVVGFDWGRWDRRNGAIFTSDNGVSWVRLAEDDPALTLGAVLMYAVTEGGPGLVAVGAGCENDTGECAVHPTVWTSVDGTSWTRSPEDPAVFGDGTTQRGAMYGVTDTSHGLVAVGSMWYWTVDDEGVEVPVSIHPAAWISDDGITWERTWQGTGTVVDSDDVFYDDISMRSVVEGPGGLLVAVGATLDENGGDIATVWTSVDGRHWEQVWKSVNGPQRERIEPGTTAFIPGTEMLDVAWGERGYVAVGSEDGTDAAIWQSPDGATWARIDTASPSFDDIGSLDSVAALDAGYITVGSRAWINGASGVLTVLTSPDGVTWDRIHSITGAYASDVVVSDNGIAIAGGTRDGRSAAAVWIGPHLDPEAPPPEP